MSLSPWKPGGLPVAEEQARLSGTDTGVPAHARMQRVKVYCLTDEGKWDDQGTGHVTIDYIDIEGSRELSLAVVDEVDNETLLLHNITADDIYRKQEETIISWKDPEKSLELALSFQEAAGCSFIWDNMRYIQQNLQSNVLRSQVGPCPAFESREASRESLPHDESLVPVHGELKDLPPLELSSLALMLKIILEHGSADKMRVAELISQDHEFFPKLVNLFRMCEALKNIDGLHMIFRLVKGIILLNNSAIYEKIFSDALILDIIGALEYDPEVHNLQSHRAFVQEHVVFKEAIPIRNASVVSKIHQTYRIGYIKDVIFPRALDDATLASLNNIIQANNAIVSRLLKDDASFIHELITRMKSSKIPAESKSKLVLFLHELCTLSKSLQPVQQLQLSRDLISEGVLDIISDVLQSHDKVVASTGTSILMHFLGQDPNLVITYIAHQDKNCEEVNSLLEILIQGVVTDSGGEMHIQCSQILRTLMDSSPVDMTTRAPARNILRRKKCKLEGNNYNCVLCMRNREETAFHLFFSCPFSERCWRHLNINWNLSADIFTMLAEAKRATQHQFFMEFFIITAWQIWRQCNNYIFQRERPSYLSRKNNLVEEATLQAHRMIDSKKDSFLQTLDLCR